MMVRVLLYGYATGVRSSRKIERATYEDVAFRYLAADQHPDHDVIAEFRKNHLAALSEIFLQMLRLCQRAGLVKVGQIAIDGTKLRANASRQQSKKYARLSELEKLLADEVRRRLEEAQAIDQREDEEHRKNCEEIHRQRRDVIGSFAADIAPGERSRPEENIGHHSPSAGVEVKHPMQELLEHVEQRAMDVAGLTAIGAELPLDRGAAIGADAMTRDGMAYIYEPPLT